MTTHNPTSCHLCNDPAVAVFYLSHGCGPDTVQPLCLQHIQRAQPNGGIELIKDLTTDGRFKKWFHV